PHCGDCTKFVQCTNSQRYIFDCPTGLIFDAASRKCSYAYDPTYIWDECTTSCSGKPYGLYAHCGDCSKFVKCYLGTLSTFDCLPNLYYNAAVGQCDYVQNAVCRTSPYTGPTSATSPTSPSGLNPLCITSCEGKNTGNHPDCDDCTQYFTCVGNTKFTMPCPSGTNYDTSTGACAFPADATC
ncbi:hypothetical protein LOTGIDRAFT_93046, partial [Lottia gigantea]